MTPLSLSAIAPALLTCVAVPAYVVWALPRLTRRAAAVLTVAGAALCSVAGLNAGPAWWVPAVGLVVGHLGWALGRRSSLPVGHVEHGSTAAPAAHTADVTTPFSPPRVDGQATLGHYVLIREIGRGAMGSVWLAHDPLHDRAVAVKTLAWGMGIDADTLNDARARFFQEVGTARQLEHPSIVRLLDAGEADGLAYLVMDHLKGADLRASTRPGTLLPIATVLHLVGRVAHALGHAHARGVVHRDVKPANVVFDPETGHVTLTDFGIASVGDAARTRTGVLLGTPAYMSPEQLGGRRVDGRSDLYALGVVLFELLTGELPHRAASMGELMQQIGQQRAPDVRSLRPELPGALADLVAHALEKRPDQRLPDGGTMARELALIVQALAPNASGATSRLFSASHDTPDTP